MNIKATGQNRTIFTIKVLAINTLNHEGGGRCTPPPLCGFLPFTKKNLKIFDFSLLFIADAPMKKKFQKLSFIPAQSTYVTSSVKIF